MTVIKGEAELLREVLGDGAHGSTLSALESLMMKEQLAKNKKEAEDGNNNSSVSKNGEDKGLSSWFNTWDGCLGGGFSFDELLDNMCGDVMNAKTAE